MFYVEDIRALLMTSEAIRRRATRARRRDRINACQREWRRANPDLVRAARRREGRKPPRPRPANPSEPAILGWTAGIVDGEGSVQINRFRPRYDRTRFNYTVGLQVGATDLAMIRRLHDLWGGSFSPAKRRTRSGRKVFTWTVRALRAAEILALLRPYLVTKSAQADLVLEFRVLGLRHPEFGEIYRSRLRALRKLGSEPGP